MWKIKDPTLKEKINHLLSDEIVAQGCNRQMDNNFDYILLSCGEVDISAWETIKKAIDIAIGRAEEKSS